ASRGWKTTESLIKRAAGQSLRRLIDYFMRLHERRILVRQVVHPVRFHETGNTIGCSNDRVSQPWGSGAWLPCQANSWLEIADSTISVISGPNLRGSGNQIKVHVLTVGGLACRSEFITQAEVQRQVIPESPVILRKNPEEAVAQVFIATASIALLNITRQTEQKIGDRVASRGAVVACKLAVKEELAC